ncbi:metallophosphoesterase [Nocardia sp. NRRL S-836]|uniref:metallophosphoesterase n=1 Tax=Nocardia sp. NRRL S-836 TaxID=1519492 RepID=UPI0006AF969C|nr:metallophosphoesterase [Nocardia sp. NRRL S-836]KOV85170.1 metallophosphoesterase [Nocardia sp. NRRL S-836]
MTTTVARPRITVRRVVFTLVLLTVTTALFWVPFEGLFAASAQWPDPVRPVAAVVFAAAAVSMIVLFTRRNSDRAARVSHFLLGFVWIAFVWTLIADVLRLVLAVSGVDNPLRSRVVAVLLAVLIAAVTAYGVHEAMRVPRIKRQDVTIPRLDPAFDGLTVAVITDTHYGAIDRAKWSRGMVDAVNGLNADVAVHVGDIADGTAEQRREQASPLGDVNAAHRFYITGNHEYYSNAQGWIDLMTRLGWKALHNEHAVLERGGARLVFAGIDDITANHSGEPGHAADLALALRGTEPADPVVLLAHQPSEVRKAVEAGVDLQLSGHTHGGQIWPFHYLVRLQQPVVAGLSRHGDRTQLYTSRGAGFWGPPMRVFAPSEITLLTLKAA